MVVNKSKCYHMVLALCSEMNPQKPVFFMMGMENNNITEPMLRPYANSIDIGHSKSGSAHILILKSLKVSGDDAMEVLQRAQLMIDRINQKILGSNE